MNKQEQIDELKTQFPWIPTDIIEKAVVRANADIEASEEINDILLGKDE